MVQGRTISSGVRAALLPTGVSVVVGALVAIGVLNGFASTAAVADTVTWTPQTAETAAPPVAASFAAPNDVDHDARGRLVVADFAANGLLRRDADGSWQTIAVFGTHATAVWNPSAVVALADGRFVVAEAGRRTVGVLDRGTFARIPAPPTRRSVSELAVDGSTVWASAPGSGALWTADLSVGDWTRVDGPWTDPGGVALTEDGRALVVSDAQQDEVWRLDRSDGTATALGFPTTDRVRLLGVAVDDEESVFVVDNAGGRVWSRTGDGWSVAIDAAPDGSALANPTAVSVDAGQRMAVADYNRQRVVTASRLVTADPSSSAPEVSPPTGVDPTPTVPAPSGPSTTEPASTEPTPTEPPSTEPTPTEPASTEQAQDPTPTPTPTEPAPTPTAPATDPTPALPTPTEPAPDPTPSGPAPDPTPVTPTGQPVTTAPTPPATEPAPTTTAAPAPPTTTPPPSGTPSAPATQRPTTPRPPTATEGAATAVPPAAATPTGSATKPTGGSLAFTGAAVTGPLVAAAVLLGIGVVLLVTRDRRPRHRGRGRRSLDATRHRPAP